MLQSVLLDFLVLCWFPTYRWSVQASERPVDRNGILMAVPRYSLNMSHPKILQNAAQGRPQPPLIGRGSIKQKLDHFSADEGRSWRQFYMHRKSPQQRPDGAVFLVVGGENGADRAWLSNQGLPYVQLADRINASIYLLEHRFYGNSRPTENTSVPNLKYLNAKQAVEDIDRFVQEVNKREKLTNPKWITFGGSYSGSLAAWSREKHPRHIRAAVASSAPLLAKLNFKEFEMQVEKIVEKEDVKCIKVLRKLFQKMREMTRTVEGRRELVRIFRLDDSLIRSTVSEKDIANFFLVISNYISFIVMHSGINVKGHRDQLTLQTMCRKLTDEPSLQSIRDLIGMVMVAHGKSRQSAIDIGYSSFLEFMHDQHWNSPRAWLYQNCNEFGHFRTSEDPDGLFAGTLPLSFFLDRCKDVFGAKHFSPRNLERKIAETNKYFGGNRRFKATDVVLPNGSDDPWTLLGVYNGTSAVGNDIILIEGTSHVADFYPPSDSDSKSLKAAQHRIIRKIENIVL